MKPTLLHSTLWCWRWYSAIRFSPLSVVPRQTLPIGGARGTLQDGRVRRDLLLQSGFLQVYFCWQFLWLPPPSHTSLLQKKHSFQKQQENTIVITFFLVNSAFVEYIFFIQIIRVTFFSYLADIGMFLGPHIRKCPSLFILRESSYFSHAILLLVVQALSWFSCWQMTQQSVINCWFLFLFFNHIFVKLQ